MAIKNQDLKNEDSSCNEVESSEDEINAGKICLIKISKLNCLFIHFEKMVLNKRRLKVTF